jgi:phosphotransferase system enzyme I (PtsI)
MLKLSGQGVSMGIVVGPTHRIMEGVPISSYDKTVSADSEISRFKFALHKTKEEIKNLHDKLVKDGLKEAEIFEAHLLILEDESFTSLVESLIVKEKFTAEKAVLNTANDFAEQLAAVRSEYISARSKDINDLGEQLVKNMSDSSSFTYLSKPSIIVAAEIKPYVAANLDKKSVLGFVVEQGSPISHTAILARALRIPAVVKCVGIIDRVQNGTILVVDGSKGDVLIDPDEQTLLSYM